MSVELDRSLNDQINTIEKKIAELESDLAQLLQKARNCLIAHDYSGYREVIKKILELIQVLEEYIKKLESPVPKPPAPQILGSSSPQEDEEKQGPRKPRGK